MTITHPSGSGTGHVFEAQTHSKATQAGSEKIPGKRKLLIATDSFAPRIDGLCRFLFKVIPHLEHDFDITIAAPQFSEKIATGWNVEWIRTYKFLLGDYMPAKVFAARKTMKRLVKEADLVFANSSGSIGASAIFFARRFSKPCAVFVHYLDWEVVPKAVKSLHAKKLLTISLKFYVPYIYNRADMIIVPSQGISEKLSWKNIDTERKVVHLGVDHNIFVPPASKDEAKLRLGLKPDELVMGTHSRLSREKDILAMVRGFTRLRKKLPDLKFLVVGDGLQEIRDMLLRQPGVIFAGQKDDVVPYLQAMDVYCLTSFTETTCLSVLEAMSCGLPVVATPVGFVKDYVEENRTGFFVPIGDSYTLAKKVEALLLDAELRKRVGNAAREESAKFSWSETAEEIRKVLLGLSKE